MKVLITGGAGFIGSHIAQQLQLRGEVRVLDNLRTGYRRNLDGLRVDFIEGSILDRAVVREAVRGVDYVFHLAGMVSVPESVQDPHQCVELNITGLLCVLEAAAEAGVRKLCFSSSAAIYGDNPTVPKHERMLPEPRSPYAVTKLDGEYYCRQYTEAGRLETVAFRYFNVIGPRQDPCSNYASAVPIFIRQALLHQPLTIYGDGAQTRDFIHVDDVVAANIFGATTQGLTGVFNVGYGGQVSVNDLARRIIEMADSRSVIQYAPERSGDVRHSRASVEAIQTAGFTPVSSLDIGLAETLADFRKSTVA